MAGLLPSSAARQLLRASTSAVPSSFFGQNIAAAARACSCSSIGGASAAGVAKARRSFHSSRHFGQEIVQGSASQSSLQEVSQSEVRQHLSRTGGSSSTPQKRSASKLPEAEQPGSLDVFRPPRLPSEHSDLVAKVTLSAHTEYLSNMTFYIGFCQHAAYAFGLPCTHASAIPTKTSLRTVPRSPFVHKPSQENFIKKTHSRYFKIFDADMESVNNWLEYIQANALPGVKISVQRWEYEQLGFGSKMVAEEGDIHGSSASVTQEQVKAMAEQLLKSGFGQEAVDSEGSGESSEGSKPEDKQAAQQS